MHSYNVRDVEKLVHLPRGTIRALVDAGLVTPERGPRNTWKFSFQDLIVLRTTQTLVSARVPRRRITRAIKELRRRLPDSMPLSGLSICAMSDRVVVKEGGRLWQADSGQYLLTFEGDPEDGSLRVIENKKPGRSAGGEGWLEKGIALENEDAGAALQAYERAVAEDPTLLEARINLGRLLHEAGRLPDAERVYRDALRVHASDPVLQYNLGVLLDDMDRKAEAMEAYEAALRDDPGLADCHYNLALLCEDAGRPQEAIQHMSQYRRLLATRPG